MSDSAVIFFMLPTLFFGVLLFVQIGRWFGGRRAEESEPERAVLGTIEAAIYAWLGLLVAFTFAGAASRFDARRVTTVDEANAIGTAYLRLDLLPPAGRAVLHDKFRLYTRERIAVFQTLPDLTASDAHDARARALQGEIWSDAVTALKDADSSAPLLLLPALNQMIDITTTRTIIMRTHIPSVVLGTLLVMTAVCSLLLGYRLGRSRASAAMLHTLAFALVLTVTMYVILDLDHPRVGLIRLDYVDRALSDVLAGMK